MEMLEQFFVTIIAFFIFFMLITKISASTFISKGEIRGRGVWVEKWVITGIFVCVYELGGLCI